LIFRIVINVLLHSLCKVGIFSYQFIHKSGKNPFTLCIIGNKSCFHKKQSYNIHRFMHKETLRATDASKEAEQLKELSIEELSIWEMTEDKQMDRVRTGMVKELEKVENM